MSDDQFQELIKRIDGQALGLLISCWIIAANVVGFVWLIVATYAK